MNCPWCEVEAGPRALHAHLGAEHGGEVGTSERDGRAFYEVTCPRCGARYQHVVRKGGRDPQFLAEFGREIQMVALDMLVHHLAAEHEPHEQSGQHEPAEPEPTGE